VTLTGAQKKVISNIFRDLTKLTVAALVVGQFVPGQTFHLATFIGGLAAAVSMMIIAIFSAVDNEKGG
jgi:hypothetical protein